MKYLSLILIVLFAACSSNQENNIPAVPKDPRMLNEEQLKSITSYFGNYRYIEPSGKTSTLYLDKNGTFSLSILLDETSEAEIIEGFIKAKDSVLTLVSNDEKFVKVINFNAATRSFSSINKRADQNFTETYAEYNPSLEAKMDSMANAPKQNVITDPTQIEKIKNLKKLEKTKK